MAVDVVAVVVADVAFKLAVDAIIVVAAIASVPVLHVRVLSVL